MVDRPGPFVVTLETMSPAWVIVAILAVATALVSLAWTLRVVRGARDARASVGPTPAPTEELLDAIDDPLALLDANSVVRAVNRRLCELAGRRREALVGRLLGQTLGLVVTGPQHGALERPSEQRLRAADGPPIPVEVRAVALGSHDGRARDVLCVIHDLRGSLQRHHQLEEAVRSAEASLRARNELVNLLGLELRAPLVGLARTAAELASGLQDPAWQALAEQLRGGTAQLVRVVQGLVEAGALGGSRRGGDGFAPATTLTAACSALAGPAEHADVHLSQHVAPEVPALFMGPEAQVLQVLRLLGAHAISRAPGGEVTLAVAAVPGDIERTQLLFSIHDTGEDAGASRIAVFAESASPQDTATTLNLVSARLLVHAMGGRIWATHAPGEGSTMFFTVLGAADSSGLSPAAPRRPASAAEASRLWESHSSLPRLAQLAVQPEVEPAALPHASILVVDDSAAVRELLAHQLRQAGHTVERAADGAAGIELVARGGFDLLLLDVLMPGLDGLQVLRTLRERRLLDNLSVIMISGMEEESSVAACIELGAEDYLPKPVSSVVLRARIGASLEKKRLRERSVRQLLQIEAEGRRAGELLRVILPDSIAEELQRTGTIAPRRHENVAVLFADLVGFTAYCDRHSPEEVLLALQELFTAFEALAVFHRVQKIKTIGDSFMAAAGLVPEPGDPTLRCVALGQAMIAVVNKQSAGWSLRVGVHVGPVVGGVVGTRQYLYDIWGDTVNTAQRIESNGVPTRVCVSADARRQISATHETRSLGAFSIKGKGELEIFEVSPPR